MASAISAITFNNTTLTDVPGDHYSYNGLMPGECGKGFTLEIEPTNSW